MKNENLKEKMENLNKKVKRWIDNDPTGYMFDKDGNYIPKEERKERRNEAWNIASIFCKSFHLYLRRIYYGRHYKWS